MQSERVLQVWRVERRLDASVIVLNLRVFAEVGSE